MSIATIYVALGSEVLERRLLLLQLKTIAKVVDQIIDSRHFFWSKDTHIRTTV